MISMIKIDTAQVGADLTALDLRSPPQMGKEFSAVLNEVHGLGNLNLEEQVEDTTQFIENLPNEVYDFNLVNLVDSLVKSDEEINAEQIKTSKQEADVKDVDINSSLHLLEMNYSILFQLANIDPSVKIPEEINVLSCENLNFSQSTDIVSKAVVSDQSDTHQASFISENSSYGSSLGIREAEQVKEVVDKPTDNAVSNRVNIVSDTENIEVNKGVPDIAIDRPNKTTANGFQADEFLDVANNLKLDNLDLKDDRFKKISYLTSGITTKSIDNQIYQVPEYQLQDTGRPAEKPISKVADTEHINGTAKSLLPKRSDFKGQTANVKYVDEVKFEEKLDEIDTADVFGLNQILNHNTVQTAAKLNTENTSLSDTASLPVYEQIVSDVKINLGQGKSSFRIKLHPEGLGELSIKMTMDNGKISLELSTNLSSTKDLISSQLDDLKLALANSSIQVSDFSVNCSNEITPQSFSFDLSDKGFNQNTNNQMYNQDHPDSYVGHKEKGIIEQNFKPGLLNYKI
jgi:hypothetical protein